MSHTILSLCIWLTCFCHYSSSKRSAVNFNYYNQMIVPRLRSEARGGSSYHPSTRYSSGGYANKVQHANDPDLKRALQYSYTSQAVRKWEKRWVVIHDTSMRVHKWMPAPAVVQALASQIVAEKTATISNDNNDKKQEDVQIEEQQQQQQPQEQKIVESSTNDAQETQDTQMIVDEESTSQPSQA